MIKKQTAAKIYHAYEEIENASELLSKLREREAKGDDMTPSDKWGRKSGFTFGFPSHYSDTSHGHSLYDVTPQLAKYVVEAHLAKTQALLAELQVKARMEIDGLVSQEAAA